MQERLKIADDDDAGKTRERLSELAARMIVRGLSLMESGELTETEQQEAGVSYARKLEIAESCLDWNKCADELARIVRGFSPRPGAWFEHEGSRIKVLRAHVTFGSGVPGTVLDDALTIACGEGALQLDILQRSGKTQMETANFLRGYPLPLGTVFR